MERRDSKLIPHDGEVCRLVVGFEDPLGLPLQRQGELELALDAGEVAERTQTDRFVAHQPDLPVQAQRLLVTLLRSEAVIEFQMQVSKVHQRMSQHHQVTRRPQRSNEPLVDDRCFAQPAQASQR